MTPRENYDGDVDGLAGAGIISAMEFRIRQLRQERGLTQLQVADAIGVSQGMYAQLENGKRKINVEHMDALAHLFRVHPRELIAAKEDPLLVELRDTFARLTPDERKMLVASAKGLLASHRS